MSDTDYYSKMSTCTVHSLDTAIVPHTSIACIARGAEPHNFIEIFLGLLALGCLITLFTAQG